MGSDMVLALGRATADGQTLLIPFDIPIGTQQAAFELTWDHDWSAYPTNDLDLAVVAPDGNVNAEGATLSGLERSVIENPKAGKWTIQVIGFTVWAPEPRNVPSPTARARLGTPTPSGTRSYRKAEQGSRSG